MSKDYLFLVLVMRTLGGQFKEGLSGVGLFMIKLIWSHYGPMAKLSVVLMCLTTIILAFYQVCGRSPDSMCSRVYRLVYKRNVLVVILQ